MFCYTVIITGILNIYYEVIFMLDHASQNLRTIRIA